MKAPSQRPIAPPPPTKNALSPSLKTAFDESWTIGIHRLPSNAATPLWPTTQTRAALPCTPRLPLACAPVGDQRIPSHRRTSPLAAEIQASLGLLAQTPEG